MLDMFLVRSFMIITAQQCLDLNDLAGNICIEPQIEDISLGGAEGGTVTLLEGELNSTEVCHTTGWKNIGETMQQVSRSDDVFSSPRHYSLEMLHILISKNRIRLCSWL